MKDNSNIPEALKWYYKTEDRYTRLVRKHKRLKREMHRLQLAHKDLLDNHIELVGRDNSLAESVTDWLLSRFRSIV